MGYNEKHVWRFLVGLSILIINATTSVNAQCVVASTEFETSSELCGPVLTSDEDGWYDEDLDWTKLCKSDMFIGPEYAKQEGIGGVFASDANDDMKKINSVFLLNNLSTDGGPQQYGYSIVTAQPKLIHSFCKANETPNNMYVNIGSGAKIPFVSYTVYGLNPGSSVELSFTLSNLLDPTYFDHLVNVQKVTQLNKYITKYNYSSQGVINGNALQFGVVSSDDNVSFNTSYNNELVLTNSKHITTASPTYGKSTTVTHKATVPASGNITFYFYRANDCFQIPIGIDDIKVTGTIKPSISTTGNPCPEQPLRITTKQSYPEGTKFSWKESVTGQSSSDLSFNFVPDAAETDYKVTLEVTMPGCTPAKSDVLLVHSGTCCTSDDGAPMAMTNLFYDDFGNFVSDNTYEWTDRYGTTHTETIPAGQVHTSQSHGGDLKIPYVKAYNIESSGAKLSVPLAGTVPNKTELYNHGVYVVSKYGGYPGGVPYDNSGTQTGGMLQFDLLDEGTQDDFFEIDIDHICTGKDIYFGADFASISDHAGSIEVRLEHEGNVLESEFKYFENGSDGWKHAGKDFRIEAAAVGNKSEVSIKMKVRHYGYKEDGTPIYGETRDYAIDNIIFQVCTPPDVNMESSVSTGKDILDLCTEDVLTLTSVTSDAVKRFYLYTGNQIDPNKEVGYVYQYTFQDPSTESETNPIKWETLHQEEVVKTDYFDVPVDEYWDKIFSQLEDDPKHEKRIYFRVVVGEYSDLNHDQAWKTNSAFSPCRKISISTIPVIAGLNCAACEKVKEAAIISADPATKITTNSTKEKIVGLCPGEIAKLTTKAFAPTDPTVMGITVGPDNEPRKYVASWHKGSKKASGTPGIGYTAGDETTSLNVTWEDADWYYLLVKDIEFPGDDGLSCWVWDSIHVVAYDKPTVKLDDPDPFCEGTLTSEPLKEITEYDITWYKDADTLQKTSEPVVASILASDPVKTFYYVMKDNMTGCRSDANLYSITVNAIPEETLAPISDFCQGDETAALPTSASYEVNWYKDATATTQAVTALSTLEGQTTPYAYYYTLTDKSKTPNCTSDPVKYEFTVKPSAVVEVTVTPECDKTTVTTQTTPAGATVNWTIDGTTTVSDAATITVDNGTYKAGQYEAIASATGYCDSKPVAKTVTFNSTPDPISVTIDEYLKADGTPDYSKIDAKVTALKDADPNVSIYWSGVIGSTPEDNSTSMTAPASGYTTSRSNPTPDLTTTEDEFFYYWIYQELENTEVTCPSETTIVVVPILGAPAPIVHDTIYCLNSPKVAALSTNVKINQAKAGITYELVWKDGVDESTVPSVSAAGKFTYEVAQRDKNNPGNISAYRKITIDVRGVKVPDASANKLAYCAEEPAQTLTVTKVEDNANNYYATGFEWFLNGTKETSTPTPNTSVSTTTNYHYGVRQTYTVPTSGEVCYGDTATFDVKVTFVPQLQTKQVTYLKAKANSAGTFDKNLKEQESSVYSGEDANSTINWYASDGTTCSTPLSGTPTPTVDASVQTGKDQYVYYCVSQTVDNCEGKTNIVKVVISDAPNPIVQPVSYCEGETTSPLTAQINELTNPASSYQLIWYDENHGKITDGPTGPTPTAAMRSGETLTSTYRYYVTQKLTDTGAESTESEIVVTIYANPVLSITNPSAVCETEVDLAAAVKLTNEVSGMVYTPTYFDDATGSSSRASSKVQESGTYGVQYAYNANVNSGAQCKSKIEPITVTIDTLSVLVDNVTTCPDMSAKFTSEVKTNATPVTYAWTGNGDNGSTAEFETKKFVGGNYGDHYPYSLTVTAGTCSETLSLEVVLGQGPVVGTLTISDPTNTELPTKVYTNSLTSEEYYYCGGNVTITPAYDGDGDYLLTTPSGATSSSSPFTVAGAGVYTLAFTNGCPTSVTFKLTDAQIALDNTTPLLEMCEGDKFTSSVTVTPTSGPDYSLVWKKDDQAIAGQTGLSYTIEATVAGNSGLYTVEANRKGCVAVTEIGQLKVVPTIYVTLPAEQVICEGEEAELEITNITPEGTTIEWQSDKTILTATDNERVTVQPTFKPGNGHQSTYTYVVTANNSGCKKTYQVTIKVDEPLKGKLAGVTPICEGSSSTITAESYDAATYTWSLNGTPVALSAATVVTPAETSTYKVDMTRGVCTATDEIQILVTTHPLIISMDSVGIRDRQIVMDPNRGTGVFTYWVDGDVNHSTTNTLIKDLTFSSHVINVVDENGCGSVFHFVLDAPEIYIPPYFSPNGDGINDHWIIGKLAEVYPGAVVNIYDRYGKLIVQYLGDNSEGWDGTYEGQPLPSTDYWYMVDIEEIEKQYSGHFTLMRR